MCVCSIYVPPSKCGGLRSLVSVDLTWRARAKQVSRYTGDTHTHTQAERLRTQTKISTGICTHSFNYTHMCSTYCRKVRKYLLRQKNACIKFQHPPEQTDITQASIIRPFATCLTLRTNKGPLVLQKTQTQALFPSLLDAISQMLTHIHHLQRMCDPNVQLQLFPSMTLVLQPQDR